MKLIDIHSHLLPNIDDGSDSIDKTISKLRLMSQLGVEKVFLTPHYMLGHYSNSKSQVADKLHQVKEIIEKHNINIDLVLGGEVYCDEQIFHQVIAEKLTMGNSDYVLFETEMNVQRDYTKHFIFNLQRQGFKPILAHPERYSYLHKNLSLVEELMHRDVLMQVNATSLLGNNGKKVREIAWRLLECGWVHFVASDDHCRRNDYHLPQAYHEIASKIDVRTADLLCYQNPKKVFDNQEIPVFYVDIIDDLPEKKSIPWWKRIFSV